MSGEPSIRPDPDTQSEKEYFRNKINWIQGLSNKKGMSKGQKTAEEKRMDRCIEFAKLYADQQNAALKESLAELIEIAERSLRHTWIPETEQDLQDAINDQFVNGPNRNYKAAIDRAKKLIAESRE